MTQDVALSDIHPAPEGRQDAASLQAHRGEATMVLVVAIVFSRRAAPATASCGWLARGRQQDVSDVVSTEALAGQGVDDGVGIKCYLRNGRAG